MKMPQCHGAESFEKLKAINPEAQIVLISGYVDDVEVSRLLARGALSFIQKPIKYSELVEWITKTVKIAQAGTSVEPLFH
jgi:FixJ family two-component response regulator